MGLGTYCYYNLPLIDFLPYKVGANIYAMIEEQHDTGQEEMTEEEYVLVYRNRRTGKLREFTIEDTEWQDESKWEWVETRVESEVPDVQPLVSEFLISDVEGNVTAEVLNRKGLVYMICVTNFDRVDEACAERFRGVVNRAMQEDGYVVCLTPEPLTDVYYYSFAGSEPVRCYNIDATVMKTMLRARNGLVVLRDGVIENKYNCRMIK